MKSELSDGMSNNSDFSNDSQASQVSNDLLANVGSGVLLTPTTFLSFEGLNSGVPTKTTPTVTPTTLRSIEQTFIELQSNHEPHENEAGFVPPLVHPIGNHQYIPVSEATASNTFNFKQNHWGGSVSQSSSDCDTRSTPPLSKTSPPQASSVTVTTTRRNMGGRKPVKDVSWSPEEEERRRIRRERNKAAAARCRKRRVDHTNALIMETEQLGQKKQALQDEFDNLQNIKEHLEYVLDQHKSSGSCRLHTQSPPDVKPFNNNIYDDDATERIKTELIDPFILPSPTKKVMLSSAMPICKPNRPNSLNVGATTPKTVSDVIGIPISTPSTGMTFNFESLMGGGTGLTPVSTPLVPSCSTQQRNVPVSMADLASPDAGGPPKLVSL